jgi:NADH dehydrogenase [ubiquinone] 1 alpha subcomplex assembly factor 7
VTPLEAVLARRIALTGPLTMAAFMAECLGNPRHGYYMRRDPFGAAGDFITAPEISQMFGELIGLWTVGVWRQMACPDPLRLVELGPGRGTLMADALRAIAVDPAARAAVRVHLVETSPALAALQRARLGDSIAQHETFDQVPAGPAIVIANELFDALPAHQFERTPMGWRERMVGLDDAGRLVRALAPGPTPAVVLVPRDAPGDVAEISPAAIALMDRVARRLAAQGGAALVIDFAARPGAATLQAVRGHAWVDVMDAPGEVDVAVGVDFVALARAAAEAGARPHGPVSQAAFLEALGIGARAVALRRRATAEQALALDTALERLTGADAMGHLFRVLAVTARAAPAPPGFEGDAP